MEIICNKMLVSHPNDYDDIINVMKQAQDNKLCVKFCGSNNYPGIVKGADILLRLDKMRTVSFNPDDCTLTVESGITLKELFIILRALMCTLELYGILPDMAIADAVSLGVIGSNGTIANCLKKCQMIQPNGNLSDCFWTDSQSEPSKPSQISLQSVVCGLGVMGVITSATFRCIPFHLAQEYTFVCSLNELVEKLPEILKAVYSNLYWFPLLDKVVVTYGNYVRWNLAYKQPVWKKIVEYFYWVCYDSLNSVSPFISWYVPSLSKYLLQVQFNLMVKASLLRSNYSFAPQTFMSVKSYCHGIKWLLPTSRLHTAILDIEDWSDQRNYICSTPLVISLQTHEERYPYPYLCPYTERSTCTIWSKWFCSGSIHDTYSVSMAEFESILQQNNGRKCWSAGPVYVSPFIGQMYPGFLQWKKMRRVVDPDKLLQSVYVEGDLLPII